MSKLREFGPFLTLSTAAPSGRQGHDLWLAGRAWLYAHDRHDRTVQTLHWEWYFGRQARHTGLEMILNAVDGDNGIGWHVGLCGLFTLFFTVERVPKWMRPWHASEKHGRLPVERCVGVRVFDGAVWVDLWSDPNKSSSADSWWRQIVVRPADVLLGRERHSRRTLRTGICIVPMPEGSYWANYAVYEVTMRRPRWPWRRQVTRIEIENFDPIPLPGKGTTEYNVGDDASYSIAMAYPGSVVDAAQRYAKGLVETRLRRCGREVYP